MADTRTLLQKEFPYPPRGLRDMAQVEEYLTRLYVALREMFIGTGELLSTSSIRGVDHQITATAYPGYIELGAHADFWIYSTTEQPYIRIINQSDTARDPVIQWSVGATPSVKYTMGVDDSDSDSFVVGYGDALGTANLIRFETVNENCSFGYDAHTHITSAANCHAFGDGAQHALTEGNYNDAFGHHAQFAMTTGGSNDAFGYASQLAVVGGSYNSSFGKSSLQANVSGDSNCAFGMLSLGNATGSTNTAIGYYSGYTAANVSGCVFLGNQAGYYETASNKLFIDNTLRASEADARTKALIYGIFAAATANQYLYLNAKVSTPEQFTSTLAGGTAPFAVTSTTVNTNLNADLWDDIHKTALLGLDSLTDPGGDRILFWDESENTLKWLSAGNSVAITTTTIDAIQDIRTTAGPSFDHIHSTVATGTAPLVVASTTVVTNLNADTVDGLHSTSFSNIHIAATASPTVDDDVDTYGEGTIWVEQDADKVWFCADNANGAAVWHSINQDLSTTDSPTFATPVVTGITIGANTLTTAEWAYLDGIDQALKTTDGPSFNHLHLTVATGTAPMVVASTTAVSNLNADMVDGIHAAGFSPVHIAATASPTVNDDVDTYGEGTVWVEQDSNTVWFCADNADGAAVWHGIDQDLRTTDSVMFSAVTIDASNSRNAALQIYKTISGASFVFGQTIEGSYTSSGQPVYGQYISPTLKPKSGSPAFASGVGCTVDATDYDILAAYGIYISNVGKTGANALTTQYGIYIPELTTGVANYAIYTLGATPSLFSGQVTADKFISSVAIGTSPYACTSTTLNANLNADLWDGYQFADYINQAVLTTSSPVFVGATFSSAVTYTNSQFIIHSDDATSGISMQGGSAWTNGAFFEFWGDAQASLPGYADIVHGGATAPSSYLRFGYYGGAGISYGFVMDKSGNVGINKAAPTVRLDVVGDVCLKRATGATALVLESTAAAADSAIRWKDKDGNYEAGIASWFNVASSGALEFLNGAATHSILTASADLGLGGTTFGTSATNTLAIYTGTAPSSSIADSFQLYSADLFGLAGAAYPHFRTEDGKIRTFGSRDIVNPAAGTPQTITAAMCSGSIVTNANAAADVEYDIPVAQVGMEITFYVTTAHKMKIDPNGTDQIMVLTGAAGDFLESDAVIGSFMTLVCLVANKWHKINHAGTWTEE